MAPTQRKKGPRSGASDLEPPRPFRPVAPSLAPLLDTLDQRRVYLAHVDTKPASFKRQVFAVPVLMNLTVTALFIWRLFAIGPWYWSLVISPAMGSTTAGSGGGSDTAPDQQTAAAWPALVWLVLRRASTFMLDFLLFVYVWPWPLEFAFGVRGSNGCPTAWRWAIGFRNAELCLRCSRREWDRDGRTVTNALAQLDMAAERGTGNKTKGEKGREYSAEYQASSSSGSKGDESASKALLGRIGTAMDSTRLRDKTAYLLMDGDWVLAWAAMVRATRLVDDKAIAMDDLRGVVLLYDESHGGWLSLMLGMDGLGAGGPSAKDNGVGSARDEERKKQVMKFRDALAAVGKEDLFFRWIEVIQFETSRPEGFTNERQAIVAQQIRDMFRSNNIDFDRVWEEAVGSETAEGLLS